MPIPTNNFPDTAVFPPRYFAETGYYALMARFRHVIIDGTMPHDKRMKSVHRHTVAGNTGQLTLTVPVSRPTDLPEGYKLKWSDMNVSPHDTWWEKHVTALESSYGRTPYFEFYIDRFKTVLENSPHGKLTELLRRTDVLTRTILELPCEVEFISASGASIPDDAADFRRADFSKYTPQGEYYQVRADRLGFIPGLSILDLIFNEGPEAQFVLDRDFTSK